ncbi:MAG TPA: YlxR family protein [Coriobacteriia bacterium]|jgi:hypothetical protein
MKARKKPVRTCLGCGQEADKRDLTRVVRSPEGDVAVDPSGKANGRGAYVHPRLECFEAAARKRRFDGALRVTLKEEDVDRIRRDLERVIAQSAATGR